MKLFINTINRLMKLHITHYTLHTRYECCKYSVCVTGLEKHSCTNSRSTHNSKVLGKSQIAFNICINRISLPSQNVMCFVRPPSQFSYLSTSWRSSAWTKIFIFMQWKQILHEGKPQSPQVSDVNQGIKVSNNFIE